MKEPAVATVPATEGESIDGGVMTTEDWQAFSLAVLGNSKRMPYCDEECATICQTCCTEEAQHTFMPYAAEDCCRVCMVRRHVRHRGRRDEMRLVWRLLRQG